MSPTPVFALSTAVATFVVVALLLLVAVAMIAVAVWLIRRTRRDAPALGPLEVMGDRAWRHGSAERRREMLAGARPDGAHEPAPMLDLVDGHGAKDTEDAPDAEVADADADVAEPSADDADVAEPSADGGGSDPTLPGDEDIEVEVLHRYHQPDG